MQVQSLTRVIDWRIRSKPGSHLLGDHGKSAVHKAVVSGQFSGVNGALPIFSVSARNPGFSDSGAQQRADGVTDLFCGRSCSLPSPVRKSKLQFPCRLPRCQHKVRCGKSTKLWNQSPENGPVTRVRKWLSASKKAAYQLQKLDDDDMGYERGSQLFLKEEHRRLGSTMTAIALSLALFLAPAPDFTNWTISNSAKADQLGQLRQVATIFEKAAEGISKIRLDNMGLNVLDKAATLVTGASSVDPGSLDKEINGILSGQRNVSEDLRDGITHLLENSWSTILDLVTNFSPSALTESAGSSISAIVEAGVERIATFELSSLVFLGERWLIYAPLVAIPMAWEMRRSRRNSEKKAGEEEERSGKLSLQVQLRGEKVRRELERIELRALLLDAVSSLGKAALQPTRATQEAKLIRRRIKELLGRLEELKPVEDPSLLVAELASAMAANASPSDALAYVPTTPTVDGDWRLIYVSETTEVRPQALLQLSEIGSTFPGFGLDNPRQRVWQAASVGSRTDDDTSSSPLMACNTADVRFGPIAFRVAAEGNLENWSDGINAVASFTSFSARPTEILGNRVSEDVPQLLWTIPAGFQTRTEWGMAYVDDHLRVNRSSGGQLFLFQRAEEPYRSYS